MPLDPKTADLMLTNFSAWENTLDDNQRQQLETTFKYEPDRVAAQKRFASVAFVAANTGQNVEEVSRRFEDYYMHAYARDEKGLGIVSGVKDANEFHGLLIKRANDNIVKAEKVNQARLTGRESGLSGASMPSELLRFQTAYPDATENEKLAFADTLFQASVKALPYRKLIKEASSKLSKEMESNIPSTGTFQEVASQLLSVPENDRPMVISMIGANGGATAQERSVYLSKLAGAMGRMTETVAASSLNMASDAALYVLLSPLEGQEQDTVMPTSSDDEFRILTQQIRQMADAEIAPIKGDGWWSQTGIDVARMAPQIAVTLANPAIGMTANTAYFRDTVAAQAKSEDPSLSYKQAAAIGDISAPFNAAIETVTALIPFGKIKMPFFQKWLSTATTTIAGTARKFVVRGAFGVASEVGEEMAQAVIPLWTQDALAALNKDNSGVDWEKRMPDFSQIAQQTWGPALVFGIVGGGVVSIKDIKNGRALASDVDMMVATGINPKTAVKIKAASNVQDYNTADTLFREEFVSDAKASKPDIEAATERLKARFKAQENVESLTKSTLPEYTASVTRTPTGWQVTTGDGTVIPVESAEAAQRIAVDLRQVGSQEEADTLVAVIDSYYEQGKQAETVFTGEDVQASKEIGVVGIRRDAGNAVISQRQFGPKALETVREEAEVAGIKSNTRGVFAHINGSNEVFPMRVADGAKEIVRRMNLYKSQAEGQPQVITFLHENFESTWRLGMENGTFSEQETRTAMRALLPAFEGVTALNPEEAQFINNLRTLASGKGNETMLRETVSEMVIRDVLGRDRQGRATGMKPGSISRAIEASVMGANTQEEASALKSILAAIKAFTAYLKGVFGTVDAMIKANEEGKIGAEYDTFINKVLGIDEVKQMESQTVDEVKAMLGIDEEVQAVIDAGNMAFSTSRAQPADISNVTEMPDGAQLVGPTTFSIEAYHGTPHEVDRFLTSKIGTGEGAQAFGWGLYFAKSFDVADDYRGKLQKEFRIGFNGKTLTELYPENEEAEKLQSRLESVAGNTQYGSQGDRVRKAFLNATYGDMMSKAPPTSSVLFARQVEKDHGNFIKTETGGNLYTVELLPDEEDFLDWDKPLSEQSEKVKAAIQKEFGVLALMEMTGGEWHAFITKDDTDPKTLSQDLASIGIPGIRYLDGGSRAAGEGTSNYVIFDENLVKIIEKNGQKVEETEDEEATPDIRFSISPVNRVSKSEFNEKLEELQTLDLEDDQFTMPKFNAAKDKLVDTFADEAHLMVRGKDAISPFGAHELFIVDNDDKPIGFVRLTKSPEQISINMIYIDEDYRGRGIGSDFYRYWLDKGVSIKSDKEITDGTAAIYQKLASEGYGMDIQDDRAVLLPRLNETASKVSFSISPVRNLNELSDQVEKQFAENPVGALEVKSRMIRQFAKISDKWSNERWTPQGNKIRPISEKRTVKSLDKEQAMRQAQREVELVNEGIDKLTPNTLMAYSEGVGVIQDDPLVARMLNDNGKLMSKSTAAREGRNIKDQYDDAGWIPPQWYAKAGGIMPDVMANNLGFDTASEMWAALDSSIKSHRNAKEDYAKAEAAVKAVEKAALEQAKAEAQAWRDETDAMQKEDWSPKESLVRDLITLEAIVAMFPQEIRGKIGGFVALARKASEAARLKVLQKQLERGQVLLEKHLKEQYGEAVDKLFDKYRPERKAGEKPKGKLDPDAQEISDKAEMAMKLSADQANAEIAAINVLLDADNISAEEEAKLEAMRELVQLLGDWKNASSARRESAFIALNDVLTEGWAKWKLKQLLKREQREEMRKMLKSATGKKGVASERDKMKKDAAKVLGKADRWVLNLSSFSEVMRAVFGENASRQFVDDERNASNQYEDAIQEFSERIDEFFTTLSGGVLRGERLRFDLAQPTLTVGAGGMNERNISQLQSIQALLMWQQEDGRRHMEGPRDENGAPIEGKWSYDQAWIDELTSKLSPEALEVKKFLEQLYSEEWVPLNAVYRERHGVNLPRHDKYAPITVTPQQAKAGEMVDPVSGAAVAGSILTPGSLRSRNRSALAEPEFRDALSTFIAHTKQMEHWKAYYDLAVEMQSVLGNRDVSNSVKAAVGDEGVTVLRKWIDVFAQGGTRDAAAGLAISSGLSKLAGRVATVGLLGRFSTLLVQSTQLAAASVKMPLGSYLKRFSMLMSGNLQWSDAINSEFIQRRIKSAPPLVSQAMQGLGEATRPNEIKRVTRYLGQLLSGADGLFTAGTYAILLDYHRTMGVKMGMQGEALESYAHAEAVNATEQVAQPVRTGTRSIIEVTNTNPLAKMSWAYASEARQKMALFAWSAYNAKNDPAGTAKTAFLVFVVGGLMSQVLKNLWREAKGDDDEKKWSPERLAMSLLSPITSAIPGAAMIAGEGGSLSGAQYTKQSIKDVFDGKADMKDVDTILSAMGYFNDTAGGIATLSHAGYDFAQLLDNAFGED